MLTAEDSLRLAVLMQQDPLAVRLDEGQMRILALTQRGEAGIRLNPNCSAEAYLRKVYEAISGYVLGVPHGYPAYLKRWTRTGHARPSNLAILLKLGEPEALAAVVHAEALTDELARRAWWVLHSPEHARAMLRRKAVAEGEMGPVLAEFLVEFLAYEECLADMVESVRLVLQPGLIAASVREQLWARGQRRSAYRVGFLRAQPDAIPVARPTHPVLAELEPILTPLAEHGNPYAQIMLRILQAPGQAFLHTAQQALTHCTDQGVVVHLFEALEAYFADIRMPGPGLRQTQAILERAAQRADGIGDPALQGACRELQQALPEASGNALLESLLVFAGVGEPLLAPIFGNTDAVGSGLRLALRPVTDGLAPHFLRLQGQLDG